MKQYIRIIVALGFLVALLSFVGIPTIIKAYFFFLIGLALLVIAYMLYRREYPEVRNPNQIHDEHAPEQQL